MPPRPDRPRRRVDGTSTPSRTTRCKSPRRKSQAFLAGGTWPITDWWTAELQGRTQLLFSDRARGAFGADLGQSVALAPNFALKLNLLIENEGGGSQTEWRTSLTWYF